MPALVDWEIPFEGLTSTAADIASSSARDASLAFGTGKVVFSDASGLELEVDGIELDEIGIAIVMSTLFSTSVAPQLSRIERSTVCFRDS